MRRIKFSSTAHRTIYLIIAVLVPSFVAMRVSAQSGLSWFGFEAEQGNLSGQIQTVNDASASNASALLFNSSQTINLPNPGTWVNVTSNLVGMASECGNTTIMSQVPGTDKTIAAVARVGLFITTNGGTSWTAMGTGAGSEMINNRPSVIVYDPLNTNIFWVAGIYGEGVYKTTDGGNTFHRLGNISHTDSVSVDFTDPNRMTLLAGGHEQSKTVYKSTDGGQTWTNIGGGVGGTGFSTNTYIIDSQTYLVNTDPSWGGGSPGIFRTTNGGASWQQVSTIGPKREPQRALNGMIFWNSGNGFARSSDNGQTWVNVGQNMGLVSDRAPIILPDSRIAAVGNNNIMISANNGDSWTSTSTNYPFSNVQGVIYSTPRNVFFAWTNDCGNAVLSNALWRLQ